MITRPMEAAPYCARVLQEEPRARKADPLGVAGRALAHAFRRVHGLLRR